MSTAPQGLRSLHGSPYHLCGRCGTRVHLSEMKWERGVLVCSTMDCQDDEGSFPLTGQREMAIEQVLNNITDEEPKIDEKLINPDVSDVAEDDIMF